MTKEGIDLIDRLFAIMNDPEDARYSFALRNDGALVFFDEQGWFALVREDKTNMLEDTSGKRYDCYVEDGWLLGWLDEFGDAKTMWRS